MEGSGSRSVQITDPKSGGQKTYVSKGSRSGTLVKRPLVDSSVADPHSFDTDPDPDPAF